MEDSTTSPSELSPRNSRMEKAPLVVMSFNRPDYIRKTLVSLKQQHGFQEGERDVFLFQDGAVNFHSNIRHASDEDIRQSVAVFQEFFPNGEVHLALQNIGIGLNFERAERHVFLTKGYSSAMFFEDDMVLGPHYVDTLQTMIDFSASPACHGMVGYVAAYGNHRATLEQQQARQRDIVLMGHAWGYGVTREHWLKVREVIDPYIQIISDCDYRNRPKARIGGLHKKLGVSTRSLSQDAMKMLATSYLGRTRLMPFVCQAEYVGVNGTNFTPETFAKLGYGSENLFPEKVTTFSWPDKAQLEKLVADEHQKFADFCREHYASRTMPEPPQSKFRAADYMARQTEYS